MSSLVHDRKSIQQRHFLHCQNHEDNTTRKIFRVVTILTDNLLLARVHPYLSPPPYLRTALHYINAIIIIIFNLSSK